MYATDPLDVETWASGFTLHRKGQHDLSSFGRVTTSLLGSPLCAVCPSLRLFAASSHPLNAFVSSSFVLLRLLREGKGESARA